MRRLARWSGALACGGAVDAAIAFRAARPANEAGASGDAVRFLLQWLRAPLATAAVAPSGRVLAALITRGIDAATGPVLELGPGTGVFTRALIERGVAPAALTLVEYGEPFARLLRDRFPQVRVVAGDAADPAVLGDAGGFGAVVCGLGLRNISAAQVERIIANALARLRPGGAFHLFTYGLRCPVPAAVLDRLGVRAERIGTALRNIPPAHVYRLTPR